MSLTAVYLDRHCGCIFRQSTKSVHYPDGAVQHSTAERPQITYNILVQRQRSSKTDGNAENVHYSSREREKAMRQGYLTTWIIPIERENISWGKDFRNKKRSLFLWRGKISYTRGNIKTVITRTKNKENLTRQGDTLGNPIHLVQCTISGLHCRKCELLPWYYRLHLIVYTNSNTLFHLIQ